MKVTIKEKVLNFKELPPKSIFDFYTFYENKLSGNKFVKLSTKLNNKYNSMWIDGINGSLGDLCIMNDDAVVKQYKVEEITLSEV